MIVIKTLLQKLADIRAKVSVEKRGWNDFHKYYYVTEEDAIKAVRGFLIEEKVLLLPNFRYAGREGDIATVNAEFTFVNLEEPFEERTFYISAQGQDKGDKGIYKAETGALKQVLLKVFLMSSGDDPEYEGGESTKRTSKASGQSVAPKSGEAAKEPTTDQKSSPEPPQQSTVPKAQIPPYDDSAARKAYFTEISQKLGPAKSKALGEWIRKTTGKTDLRKVSDKEWGPIVATLHAADESNGLDKLLEGK